MQNSHKLPLLAGSKLTQFFLGTPFFCFWPGFHLPPPCWCYPPSSLSHPGPALPSRLVSLAPPWWPSLGGGGGEWRRGWRLEAQGSHYSKVQFVSLHQKLVRICDVTPKLPPIRYCTTSGDVTASTTVTSPDVVYGVPPSRQYQCPPPLPDPPTSPSVGFGGLLLYPEGFNIREWWD